MAVPLAEFLGDPPVGLLQMLGAVLVANGIHLVLSSLRQRLNKWEVLYFSFGDLAWWLGAVFLIATQIWITAPLGVMSLFAVSVAVAILGVAQMWFLALYNNQRSNAEHWRAIKNSYWAMPKWVFIWLCFLNVYFLMSLFYWPNPLAVVVLLGFVATGPLLAAQIAFDGGLRRILGLGHLIPWVPLLVWLIAYDGKHLYQIGLIILLAICLAFDLFDVWRFWRGDRSVFASPAEKGHS
ncbi:hypothetical protein [Sulfitobacter donghicola]|nr:hypothetical protein [Sulfitobacter donghicola]